MTPIDRALAAGWTRHDAPLRWCDGQGRARLRWSPTTSLWYAHGIQEPVEDDALAEALRFDAMGLGVVLVDGQWVSA